MMELIEKLQTESPCIETKGPNHISYDIIDPMNLQLCFMIFGDFLLVIVMGFYAGVGIWESGSLRHILGMLAPAVAVWFLTAIILKLYSLFPKEIEPARLRQLPRLIDRLIAYQKPWKLMIVWAITCLFACLWQAYYWRHILQSQSYFYRFGIGTLIWYASSYGAFYFLWRGFWTLFAAVSVSARNARGLRIACNAAGILMLLYLTVAMAVNFHYKPLKYTVDTVPADAPRTALVFGAGVYRNGQPSAVLTDRVNTAVELYQKGLIDEMIMSGDNSDSSRNEVDNMAELALEAGVPEEAILRDNTGLHTDESCRNAKYLFGKDEVIFVSQDFHTARILMTGQSYGLGGIAVRADRRIYNIFSWGLWYLLDWARLPLYFLRYH